MMKVSMWLANGWTCSMRFSCVSASLVPSSSGQAKLGEGKACRRKERAMLWASLPQAEL